jgi:hypothetical protein
MKIRPLRVELFPADGRKNRQNEANGPFSLIPRMRPKLIYLIFFFLIITLFYYLKKKLTAAETQLC